MVSTCTMGRKFRQRQLRRNFVNSLLWFWRKYYETQRHVYARFIRNLTAELVDKRKLDRLAREESQRRFARQIRKIGFEHTYVDTCVSAYIGEWEERQYYRFTVAEVNLLARYFNVPDTLQVAFQLSIFYSPGSVHVFVRAV
jgi:hypothetical protein